MYNVKKIRMFWICLLLFIIGACQCVEFINITSCGGSKGCWLMPPNCAKDGDPRQCDSIVTWSTVSEGIQFELEAIVSDIEGGNGKYVSIGFSYDYKMGEDAVLECITRPDGNISAFLSYNDRFHNIRMMTPSKLMLKGTEGKYYDGRMVCRTVRTFQVPDDIPDEESLRIFPLKKESSYVLFFVRGPTSGPEGSLDLHSLHDDRRFPWISSGSVNVNENKNLNKMKQTDVPRYVQYNLVKVHGIFMLFGWWIFGAVAMILSRFFKSTWANKKICGSPIWFQLHRSLMIASLVLQCIAFAFVFIQAGDFKKCSDECGYKDYALKVHTILGVTCTAGALIQPFMALARPSPSSSSRPIFNWIHWFIGSGSWIIATVTIFLSPVLGKAGLNRNFQYVPNFLMAGYISSFILVTILLEIISSYYQSRGTVTGSTIKMGLLNGPKEPVRDSKLMNGTSTTTIGTKTSGTQSKLQLFVLGFFLIVAIGIVIALTVLIAMC